MSRESRAYARNAVAVVEAGYALEGTDSEWVARILEAMDRDVAFGRGSYGFTCAVSPSALELGAGYAERDLDPRFSALVGELNRTVPSALFGLLARSAVHCGSFMALTRQVQEVADHLDAMVGHMDVGDAFTLFVQDGEGHALSVTVPAAQTLRIAPHVLGIWRRVGVHLASGMRLRRHLRQSGGGAPEATFEPSGAVADARGGLRSDRSAREALSTAVRRMERARSARERADPASALELWRGLVAGAWSLVDHWEAGGHRYLAAYRNPPEVRDPRALTAHERLVLHYAARGQTNKDIAFTLGLSTGSVATGVSEVLRKLRCARRSDLVAFADLSGAADLRLAAGGGEVAVLSISHALRGSVAAGLSKAEHEIAERIVAGDSNAEIARRRGTSSYTVANQVRRIFEKVGVRRRAELVRAVVSRD